jgi:hypothetical protein
MSGPLPGVAFQHARRRVQQEQLDPAVGLSQVQGSLQGLPGSGCSKWFGSLSVTQNHFDGRAAASDRWGW